MTTNHSDHGEFFFDRNKRIAQLFVEKQDTAIQVMLQTAEVIYDSENATIAIQYPDDRIVDAKMLKMSWQRGRAVIFLGEEIKISSIKIEVSTYSELIQPMNGLSINVAANPIGAIEAVARVDRLQQQGIPAAITFFTSVREDGISLYINEKMREFTGYHTQRLYEDDSVALFATEEAKKSLEQLQSDLQTIGQVSDFGLVSYRTNGEYGVYTIDAQYVDWGGQPARLTVYKDFSPIPVPPSVQKY